MSLRPRTRPGQLWCRPRKWPNRRQWIKEVQEDITRRQGPRTPQAPKNAGNGQPRAPQAPTTFEEGVYEQIRTLLLNSIPQGEVLHEEAVDWVVGERITRGATSYTDEQLLTQYALLTVYVSTASDDMEFVVENYTSKSNDECDWYGVTCDVKGAITALDMPRESLAGSIPPTK